MDFVITFINDNIVYAPVIVFLALSLSGIGLPISEDILVIFCGVLASQNPSMALALYIGIFWGAYAGDTLTYWLGRKFGVKVLQHRLLNNKIKPEKIDKLSSLFSKKSYLVVIVGRFIPFGVRMLVYLTAGIIKFEYKKFAFINIFAVLLSTSLSFSLAYNFGDEIIAVMDKIKYVLFGAALAYILWLLASKMIVK